MALSSDIVILFFLFLLSGFFSSAEAALLSLTDLHLHKMKSDHYPFFDCVMKLLENPRRLLITIVTGNEVVNISISILAAALFISLFGPKGQGISIVVTSIVLFLAGEAIPKTFGVTYPMSCLLYTSDAADDLLCVDIGGRRIIKKKKKYIHV